MKHFGSENSSESETKDFLDIFLQQSLKLLEKGFMKQSVHFSGEHLRLYRLHRIMHTKCIFSGTFGIFCTFCTLLELRAGNSNIVWLLMCWDNYSRIKNIKPHRYTAVHLYQACQMYQQGYIYQQG